MDVLGGLFTAGVRTAAEGVRTAADGVDTAAAFGTLTGQSPADELKVARSGGFRRAVINVQKWSTMFATTVHEGVRCVPIKIDSLDGVEVVAPGADEHRVVVYFHGGAHCFGSTAIYKSFLERFSIACRARVIAVDYRLVPENPFPAGLEDALATFRWARAHYPSAQVVVAGDSAGGNLAFALLVRLAQLGEEQPDACIGLSPWLLLDLERIPSVRRATRTPFSQHWGGTVMATMASLVTKGSLMAATGEVMAGKTHDVFAAQYFQDNPASDPLISPMLAGEEVARLFPPILLHADRDEPLSADSKEMAALCRRVGVEVELELYADTMHVFQAVPKMFQEATEDSFVKTGAFLNRVLTRARPLPQVYEESQLLALSVKELKRILSSRGLSSEGCVEKIDLVQRILGAAVP